MRNAASLALKEALDALPMAKQVADQLFLLRIHGNHRDIAVNALLGLRVDVLELRVAIWVLRALDRLVGCLEAVAVLAKQLGDCLVADSNVLTDELLGVHLRT